MRLQYMLLTSARPLNLKYVAQGSTRKYFMPSTETNHIEVKS